MGIVLYEMMDLDLKIWKTALLKKPKPDYSELIQLPYSEDLKKLVMSMCAIDPNSRPQAAILMQNALFMDIRVIYGKSFVVIFIEN